MSQNMDREERAKDRAKSHELLRPADTDKQDAMDKVFSRMMEDRNWPSRPPWHLKHTQGLGIIVAEPENLRDTCVNVVVRNKNKYVIAIGQGHETVFNAKTLRLSIKSNTVSNEHAKLYFTREKGKTTVELEDQNSLNGTFVLGRPGPDSTRRPLMEREVRDEKFDLRGVEYIRLGPVAVLALDATNIFWEDEDDEEEEEEVDAVGDKVPDMFAKRWYFPRVIMTPPA